MSLKRLFLRLLPAVALAAACTSGPQPATLSVLNESDADRPNEMVAVSAADLLGRLQLSDTSQFVILNAHGLSVPYQVTYDGLVLFRATVPAGGRATYTVQEGDPLPFAAEVQNSESDSLLAWSDDHMAYLSPCAELGSAAFVLPPDETWQRGLSAPDEALPAPVRQALQAATAYEGGRLMLVGHDSLAPMPGWREYEVLDGGPLRFTLKLLDAPLPLSGESLRATRIVQLDAGNRLNKVTVRLEGNHTPVRLAALLPLRSSTATALAETGSGLVAVADTAPTPSREVTFAGCVLPTAPLKAGVRHKKAAGAAGYAFAMQQVEGASEFTYYFGATHQDEQFPTWQAWVDYLAWQARCLRAPLRVVLK